MKITVSTEENVIAGLTDLYFDSKKLKKFGRIFGSEMVHRTHLNFELEKSPYGDPWIKSKRAIKQNGETLRDTGRLYNSITYNVFGNGVEWGSGLIYAGVHNYGFVSVDQVIPQREFLGFTEDDELFALNTLEEVLGFE